jgi:NADH-quinone oxidoreductase subunit H
VAERLAQLLTPSWQWLAYAVVGLVHVALVLAFVMFSVAVFVWMERKVSARIQDRLGPTRVGGRFGWLQTVADGIKLLCKEDIVPSAADGMLFRVAPYISFAASFAAFLAIPFATGWVALQLNAAAFFVVAVAGIEVFGVILGGYASGSKYSLYGAMREAAQVVSYEVPLGLCVVLPVMLAGTMDLVEIGRQQAGWCTNWFVLHDPFTFITFWVYLACATANVNRAPFDLPEAESELVAGFMTEYSGFRWVIFFMGEYTAMLGVSAMAALLFLGGWNGPVPITAWLCLTHDAHPVLGWLGDALGFCNFAVKCYLGIIFIMWLRWTLPRLRIDQVMTMCLKYCIPIAAAMLLGAMTWMYVFPAGVAASLRGAPQAAAQAAPSPAARPLTQSATFAEEGAGRR